MTTRKDKKELPKYLRIEGDFRARIERGRLRDGDMLPDERTLARSLGCNRLTVSKAYNHLQEKGYVHKVQGSGVYVGRKSAETEHTELFAGARQVLGLAMAECYDSGSSTVFKEHAFGVFRSHSIEPICLSYVTQGELRRRLLLYSGFLSGVIFYAGNFDAISGNYRFFEKTGRPLLVYGLTNADQLERFGSDAVCPDSLGGGALAAEYFLRRGHKRIVIVCTDEGSKRIDRVTGFVERLDREGVRPILLCPKLTEERQKTELRSFSAMRIKLIGMKAAKMAMSPAAAPTAIFCQNDSLAVGVHEQLKAMGVKCPEDVELLGCGGDRETVCFYRDGVIPVSTIATPHEKAGEIAAKTLLLRLENPAAPRQVIAVPMSILHRQTTMHDFHIV